MILQQIILWCGLVLLTNLARTSFEQDSKWISRLIDAGIGFAGAMVVTSITKLIQAAP